MLFYFNWWPPVYEDNTFNAAPGMAWFYYISNDLQFYAFVLLPLFALYFHGYRKTVFAGVISLTLL